jgi:hypothetical protein
MRQLVELVMEPLELNSNKVGSLHVVARPVAERQEPLRSCSWYWPTELLVGTFTNT